VLLFKRKFQAAIRDGTKTQTVRLWRRQIAWPGQVRTAPGVGYLRVLAVDEIALDDLTETDATADGFESLAALRAELDGLYDEDARRTRRCYRVTFEYLGQKRPE